MSSFVKKKGSIKKIKLHEIRAYSHLGENGEGEKLMDCDGEHVTTQQERESDLEEDIIKEKDYGDEDEKNLSLKDKHFYNVKQNKRNKLKKKDFRRQTNEMIVTSNFINESISNESGRGAGNGTCSDIGSGSEEKSDRNGFKNDGTFSEYDLRYNKEGITQKGLYLEESEASFIYGTGSDSFEKDVYKRKRRGSKTNSNDKKNCKKKKNPKGISKHLQRLLSHANINNTKRKVYDKDTIDLEESGDFRLVGAVTEYTNIREENIESIENCRKRDETDMVIHNKIGGHFDTTKIDYMDNIHTKYDTHVYNAECANKLYSGTTYFKQFPNEITYNETNYEDAKYKKVHYNCENKNTLRNEHVENGIDTTKMSNPEKEHMIKKQMPMKMKNKMVTNNVSCNQWNITNEKEQDMVSCYSQETYNLNGSDVNEDLQGNVFALNNVNINDLYNSETETGKIHLAKTQNSSDLLINTYDKKGNIHFLYNFLKKSKIGKNKKKKMELREVNNGYKQRHHFYNDREKIKQAPVKGFLYTDSCITFENTDVAEKTQQLQRNQKLKYKHVENKTPVDSRNVNEEETKKKKKKLKATNKRKTKISVRLLKDMQENESIKKWKQKLRLIQKVASADKKKTKIHVLVFIVFLCLNIFINYDSGILPVSLNQITKDFNLSITLQGLIGAMPYIGLTLASFFLGTLLQKYEQKKLLQIL